MGTNRPRTKDFFATPALSLSLAGVFRDEPAATSGEEAEAGDEGSGRQGEGLEISSENTAPDSQSGDSEEAGGEEEAGCKKRRRKNYRRHTAEQIRVMEALFKESPHPDEKQRQQLSKQLGLSTRQVKFWFQNRRTQIKAIQERHENSLLRSELEKLYEENRAMRETINKSCCPHCGLASSSSSDTAAITEEQQLRLENAKLRAEIENLRGMQGKAADGISSPGLSCSGATQNNQSSVDDYRGFLGHNKSRILELVNRALDELTKMSSSREPLWVRSFETGRDILNYDEYVRAFPHEDNHGDPQAGWSVEASRGSGVVFLDIMQLVHAFMDANQWKELFPSMLSKAATLDVIRTDENDGRDGVVQLMFAGFHMLTPMVPTRDFYFVRYCKKLSEEKWAIVDVSIDKVEEDVNASSSVKCWKMPSGCILEEQVTGHCKVTWVEHTKCQKSTTPSMYRTVIASGLAFGAKRWIASLQVQCERMVFSMATNVPTKDSNGVPTLAGRKSILKLTQRMTASFCRIIGGSRDLTWKKVSKGGDDIRLTSRKNIGEPGEPQGLIACAVLSTWLPVNPTVLFNFLKDESRSAEYDAMLPKGPVEAYVNLAKGKNSGNCVKAYANKSAEQNGQWILQDSCTNSFESLITYTPVDVRSMQRVIHGHESSDVAVLPCGFSVLPDELESKPTVITSREEEKTVDGGSLITVALQIKASSSPAARLSPDSVETLTSLVSCTLRNIKKSLRCDDC